MLDLSLRTALSRYVARRINLRASSANQLGYSVSALEKHAGSALAVSAVDADMLCGWLRARLQAGISAETVRRDRRNVLTVLRFALTQGWVTTVPDVETIKREQRLPTAWTLPELSRLLAAADSLTGSMRGLEIPRRWWFRGLLLFLYDTGASLSAALSLRTADVWIDRCAARLRAATDKNRSERICLLSQQTVGVLTEGLTDRPLVFPYPWHRRKLWRDLKSLEISAGLPSTREFGFHCLRRTHATQAVIAAGWNAAQASLGHTSEQMTRVYVDQTQVQFASRIDLPRPMLR